MNPSTSALRSLFTKANRLRIPKEYFSRFFSPPPKELPLSFTPPVNRFRIGIPLVNFWINAPNKPDVRLITPPTLENAEVTPPRILTSPPQPFETADAPRPATLPMPPTTDFPNPIACFGRDTGLSTSAPFAFISDISALYPSTAFFAFSISYCNDFHSRLCSFTPSASSFFCFSSKSAKASLAWPASSRSS